MGQKKKYTNTELIRLLKGKTAEQDQALRYFCSRRDLDQRVKAMVRKYHKSIHDAEDVFQESLMEMAFLVQQDRYRQEGDLEKLILGIARNKLLSRHRKESKFEYRAPAMLSDFNEAQGDLEQEMTAQDSEDEYNRAKKQVYEAVGSDCEKILIRKHQGYSSLEIAEELGKKLQTIRNRSSDCQKKMRDYIFSNPDVMSAIKSNL